MEDVIVPPRPGDIVLYRVKADDPEEIRHNQADILPAIVIAAWTDICVSVQVLVDGPGGTAWKTSIMRGQAPGQWFFPRGR